MGNILFSQRDFRIDSPRIYVQLYTLWFGSKRRRRKDNMKHKHGKGIISCVRVHMWGKSVQGVHFSYIQTPKISLSHKKKSGPIFSRKKETRNFSLKNFPPPLSLFFSANFWVMYASEWPRFQWGKLEK